MLSQNTNATWTCWCDRLIVGVNWQRFRFGACVGSTGEDAIPIDLIYLVEYRTDGQDRYTRRRGRGDRQREGTDRTRSQEPDHRRPARPKPKQQIGNYK